MAKGMPGCVSQRPNGTWFYNIPDGKDPVTGKRKVIYKSGFATQEEAEAERAKILLEKTAGLYVESTKQTVSEYMDSWLRMKKTRVRYGTWLHYETMIRTHVNPKIGHLLLKDVRPSDLYNFYERLLSGSKPLAPQYIVHMHRMLYSAFEHAASNLELIKKNVVKQVEPPKVPSKQMQIWNRNQLFHFLKYAKKDRYFIAFLLAASTGMRKGEIIALRWKDIDFHSNILMVRQGMAKTENGKQPREPKTKSSIRPITLPELVIGALLEHKHKQEQEKKNPSYKDHGFVIQTSKGTPLSDRNLSRTWYRLVEGADLPMIRFHDLRHTHSSLLLEAGENIKVISERLGHASSQITMDVYSHLLPNMQAGAAVKVQKILEEPIALEEAVIVQE